MATDSWKNRFAFVSSNFLGFGFFLFGLWPIASQYYVGEEIKTLQGILTPKLFSYHLMVFLISVAFTVILLSITHIFSRGLLLAINENAADISDESVGGSQAENAKNILNEWCLISYRSLLCIVYFILISILFAFIHQLIVGIGLFKLNVGESISIVGILFSIYFLGIFLILFVKAISKKIKSKFVEFLLPFKIDYIKNNLRYFILGFITLLVIIGTFRIFVIKLCYTLEIETESRTYIVYKDDIVSIKTKFGGTTSDVSLAQLSLKNQNGVTKSLNFDTLEEGQFITTIKVNDLNPGNYTITLEYPHKKFTESYPFIENMTKKEYGFIVTQIAK